MEDIVEDDPADGGRADHPGGVLLLPLPLEPLARREPELDPGVNAHLLLAEGQEDLVGRRVDPGLDARSRACTRRTRPVGGP